MSKSKKLQEFPEHLQQMLNLIEQNRQRLETEMNSGLADSDGAGFNTKHATAAVSLAKAYQQLGQETRQWLDTLRKKAKNLGQDGKVTLAIQYILGLPVSTRHSAYKRLEASEKARPDGIDLRIPDREVKRRGPKYGGKPRTKLGSDAPSSVRREAFEGTEIDLTEMEERD